MRIYASGGSRHIRVSQTIYSSGGRRRSRGRGRSGGYSSGPSGYVVQPLRPSHQAVVDAYIRREIGFWRAFRLALKAQLSGEPLPPKVWREG